MSMTMTNFRFPTFVAALLVFACAILPARAEVSIQDVVSPKGVHAWLVEDYTVPIISCLLYTSDAADE